MSCSTPTFIYERKAIWTFNLILSFMKQKIYLVSKQQKGLIAFFLFTQFLGFSVDFFYFWSISTKSVSFWDVQSSLTDRQVFSVIYTL